MRGTRWSGMLLLAVLPGCFTRMVWQRTHRTEVQWTATAQLAVHEAAEGSDSSMIVMSWPKAEQWQRSARAVYPPTSRSVGLAEDLPAVRLVPVHWPESIIRLIEKSRSSSAAECGANITITKGDAEVELELGLYRDDEAALAEVCALPGVVMERFCYTCGASAPRFRDRARVAPTTVVPKSGVPVSLVFLRRTPISVGEQVLLTPFVVAADLPLLPFELLTIRVWW